MRLLLALLIILAIIPSVTAITISDVTMPSHLIRDNAALIHWDTNDYAIGSIDYGTTTSYGTTIGRPDYVRTHMYDLEDLQAGTTYYYRINVEGRDGSLNTHTGSFTTEAALSVQNIPGQHLNSRMTLNQANTRYVLQGDITAERDAFLIQGNNIILDLNGYTITYDTHQAIAQAPGTPNEGFEDGTNGWILNPPTAFELKSDGYKPMEGDWHLDLIEPSTAGASMTSPWAYLPPNTDATASFVMDIAGWNFWHYNQMTHANAHLYSGGTTVIPPTTKLTGAEATVQERSNVRGTDGLYGSDDIRFSNTINSETGEHAYQAFDFYIENQVDLVSEFMFHFQGYALKTTAQVGDTFKVYIFNYVTGNYELLGEQTNANIVDTKIELNLKQLTVNIPDYISGGIVSILVVGDHATAPGVDAEASIHTDTAVLVTGEAPEFRWDLEEEGVGVIRSIGGVSSIYQENKFTTDANGGRYRQIMTVVDWNGDQTTGYHKGTSFDQFDIRPRDNIGIRTSGNDIIVRNGNIIQGRGESVRGHTLYMEGQRNLANNLHIESYGVEAYSIYFVGGVDSAALDNDVISIIPRKFSRHQISAPLGANYMTGMYWYNNTVNSGNDREKSWGALNTGGTISKYVSYNTFNIKTQTTNHHALVIWMGNGIKVHNNVITADPGQGMLFSGDVPAITNVKAYDNKITMISQEPNIEYGVLSNDAIRLNDYGSNGCNGMWIDGNDITVYGDFNDKYKVVYNGQVANGIITGCSAGSSIVVSNNHIKAIQLDPDTVTSAIEPASKSTANTIFRNNIFEGNDKLVMLGGYKSYNDGVLFENNTWRKYGSNSGYRSIYGRSGPLGTVNVEFIDSKFENGASFDTSQVYIPGSEYPWEFYVKYNLALTVTDTAGSPLSNAAVSVRDINNNLVATGSTDAQGKFTGLLIQKRMYGNSGGGATFENYLTPHTVEITKSGYNTYTNTINMDTRKELNVALSSTGPGVLLYSNLNTLANVQTPSIYTTLMNPLSSAIVGNIGLSSSPNNGGINMPGGNEQFLFGPSNVDLADLSGDGGRIDWWMKFNEDPHSQLNQWFFRVHNNDYVNFPGVDRWLAVETLGSAPNTYLWVVMYSDHPDSWDDTFDVWTGSWDYWINDVQPGEWHLYTITWKNNGPGDSELHLYIDGQNTGCPNCNAYNGYVPPAGSAGLWRWGGLLNNDALQMDLDEVWSFSRWNHGYGPGTYADLNIPDQVVLLSPSNNELLYTDYPNFKFLPKISTYENDVCFPGPTGTGGFNCELFVDGASQGSIRTCHDTITEFPAPQQYAVQPATHNWYVTCDSSITSNTNNFQIDPSGFTECFEGTVDDACRTIPDDCPGSRVCTASGWSECVDDPLDECPGAGVGGLYVFQNGKYGYDGQEDICISSVPDNLLLTLPECTIRDHGWGYRMLMMFDLSTIPSGSLVESATLDLQEYSPSSTGDSTMDVSRLLKPWSLTGATWSCTNDENHDGCVSPEVNWQSLGANGLLDSDLAVNVPVNNLQSVSVDVTDIVASWVDGSADNNGFLLHEVGNIAGLTFAPDTYTSDTNARPKLTVRLSAGDQNPLNEYDTALPYGTINFDDFMVVVGAFRTANPDYDYNNDNVVNVLDLVLHLLNWNTI